MAIKQVAVGGFPYTAWLNEAATNQVGLTGQAWVMEEAATNASPSVTGVAATSAVGSLSTGPSIAITGVPSSSAVGTLSISLDEVVQLTGVSATTGIGDLTASIDSQVTLTGVETDSAIGSPTVEIDLSIDGVETDSAIGDLSITTVEDLVLTGVSSTVGLGTITLQVDTNPSITGVQTTSGIGSLRPSVAIDVTGVEATSDVGDPVATLLALFGQVVTTGLGTLTVTTGSNQLVGVQSTAAVGTVHAQVTGNLTNVTLTGVQATVQVGVTATKIETDIAESLIGVQAAALTGVLTTSTSVSGGLTMTEISCDALTRALIDDQVTLRWSDTDGQSWSDSARRSIGDAGQYLTNPQWRRLGMSRRGRVFELSWSCSQPTCLQGATVTVEDASR